jgi:hypothetical protein
MTKHFFNSEKKFYAHPLTTKKVELEICTKAHIDRCAFHEALTMAEKIIQVMTLLFGLSRFN